MLWHCFSPWKLVPLDIWTSLNLESPLTWFCSHSDVANLIFARELHGILSKQICYLLWLLPLSVISQPLHLENTTLRPFHEAGSFTAMQQKGHHAAKRQLHDTFNSGETAEGKKKERKKKKKPVSEKTDRHGVSQCQLRTNLWYSRKHSQPSQLHFRMRQVTGDLAVPKEQAFHDWQLLATMATAGRC